MAGVLEVRHLAVAFGGVQALRDFNMEVREGTVTGLVGPNGAGKTTALDAMTGFVSASGSVRLNGRELQSTPPHVRARHGMVRTWQGVQLFDDLTVRENLLVGMAGTGIADSAQSFSKKYRNRALLQMLDQLAQLGLNVDDILSERAGTLSHGQKMTVGLCRSLVRRPKVLLTDEPAAGLDIEARWQFGRVLKTLAERGIAIILVDHDTSLVLRVSDEVYVLDQGALIARGTPDEIRNDERVIASYLGPRASIGQG